jgi:hypothetical protein
MGPVNIETMLRSAWKTQFGQASSFISARVEEVGVSGPPVFIPVSLNIERRNFCVRWSSSVGVEVVAAWQRGEAGCSGGFYSKKEATKYKVKQTN